MNLHRDLTDKEFKNLENSINDHWEYVRAFLDLHGENLQIIEKIEYHYKTAFYHGYKHGSEKISK